MSDGEAKELRRLLRLIAKKTSGGKVVHRVAAFCLGKYEFAEAKHVPLSKFVEALGLDKSNVRRAVRTLDRWGLWRVSGKGRERTVRLLGSATFEAARAEGLPSKAGKLRGAP